MEATDLERGNPVSDADHRFLHLKKTVLTPNP